MQAEERQLLAIVCRNPEVGRVKTRLIPALGEEGVRALYSAFLRDLHSRFANRRFDLRWAYTPEGGPLPAALVPELGCAQEGPDLGHRLLDIFTQATAEVYDRVVVISSDVPHLPLAIVEQAFEALARCDVVLAPSEDGGYHLVGMSAPHDIFTMVPMSTPAVLSETLAVIDRRALSLQLLDSDFDVDLPDDLPRLAARLEEDEMLRGGHTAHALRQGGPVPQQ